MGCVFMLISNCSNTLMLRAIWSQFSKNIFEVTLRLNELKYGNIVLSASFKFSLVKIFILAAVYEIVPKLQSDLNANLRCKFEFVFVC